MKVSALEEYGLRCMLLMVQKGPDLPVTLPEFSKCEGITIPYAGKLLMTLKRAGLVKAVRGRNGGYVLTQPPEQTSLKHIFAVLGEPLGGPHHCTRFSGSNGKCVHVVGDCRVKEMWNSVERAINRISAGISLADLATENTNKLNRRKTRRHANASGVLNRLPNEMKTRIK